MHGLTCNTCNKQFADDTEQKPHFKSEWHRYNLKRKITRVLGLTEELFLVRESALAEAEKKMNQTPMLCSCGLCGKGYRSSKAHAQHLKSKSHILHASQGDNLQNGDNAIIRPLICRTPVRPPPVKDIDTEESDESEWEKVGPEDGLVDEAADSLTAMNVNWDFDVADTDNDEEDEFEELDPTCCSMCDSENETLEDCMVLMHKKHGFFISDTESLRDPKGLFTYP